ncbi:MAG: acyltransferase family protein [Patescibacteria group bacterium]
MIKEKRWAVLDIAKAIAVIFMILGHNLMWWYTVGGHRFVAHFEFEARLAPIIFGVAALFVMTIPIIAGMALRFHFRRGWDEQKRKLIRGKAPALLTVVQLAIYISALGFLLNYLNWDWDDAFNWNVLQFFALSLIVITLTLKFLSLDYLLALAAAVLLSAAWLREFFWRDGNFAYLETALFGEPSSSNVWPFFPWFAIVVFGFLIAQLYLLPKYRKRFSKILIVSGGILISTTLLFSGSLFYDLDFANVWGATIFQPPLTKVLGQLGFFAVLFAGLHYFFSQSKLRPYGVINVFSHGILYIYLFHFTIGYQLTNAWKLQYEFKLLGISLLLQLLVAYLIGAAVVFLKRRKGRA